MFAWLPLDLKLVPNVLVLFPLVFFAKQLAVVQAKVDGITPRVKLKRAVQTLMDFHLVSPSMFDHVRVRNRTRLVVANAISANTFLGTKLISGNLRREFGPRFGRHSLADDGRCRLHVFSRAALVKWTTHLPRCQKPKPVSSGGKTISALKSMPMSSRIVCRYSVRFSRRKLLGPGSGFCGSTPATAVSIQ